MLDDGHLTPPKTPSDTDSNSNSGSLFSRRYPDELSSNSSGSKENTPSLQNNENLLSPKLPSQRRVFNGFSPENFKCQPKLTRRNSIDLSINGEKSNSDDEWFAQRFKPNRNFTFHATGVTRTDVQKCLRMRLAEMRRRDQQKRKAMYDADNGIVDDESESAEIDICKLMNDEESKALECDFGEKSLENNAVVKEKDVKPKYDLMRHEADESNDDDRETFIQEYEVNEKKRSIENRNNEIEEEIAEKNGSIYLNEGLNEVVAEDNDDKFVSKENIFDEDLRKDWLQTGTKTYESLMEHKDHEKVPIDNSDDDDRDDEDEDELIRRHRKPRKRRLLFTPDDSDEDKDNEDKDALKSIKNVRNLEADDRNDIETSSISNQKKTNSIDDVNALLNESDEFNVNKQDSFLFSDEDDDHKRNVIEPIDEVNDENQQVEGVEEANSSDDELKIFRELERAQKAKKKLILKSEYIDEEASLSGDDVGSDENDDEDQLNVYEAEEGDNDELPDDETIREQLHKQWLKQQQDEEDRKLLYWKDQLLIDGDLTEETDRTFRFKLRVTENENTNEEMDDVAVDAENIEVDDDEVCKRRREISKWKIETKKTELHGESTLLKKTNPLLKAASKIIDKGNLNGNSQSDEQADALVCKNSLLYHRKSLSQVLNQTKITLYTKSAETSNARANEHTKEHNGLSYRPQKEADRLNEKEKGRNMIGFLLFNLAACLNLAFAIKALGRNNPPFSNISLRNCG
ncbi:unnamed protein product, partial [Onchocerca ochengi]|uniref:MRC1 domain-containing protein n=1 Tax=Onchocerca ochengi TaxID=42157 RepID=A0A182EAH1_ONCOC